MITLRNRDRIDVLTKAIKTTTDAGYATRLKAILLIKKGVARHKVADTLVVSRRSVTEWIKIYNTYGKQRLQSKKTGRPKGKTQWDASIFKRLTVAIDASDQYWSVRLMQDWIQQHAQQDIPASTIWYRIRQIGYSNKSSRPYPYKGDQAKQAAFKKRDSKPASKA